MRSGHAWRRLGTAMVVAAGLVAAGLGQAGTATAGGPTVKLQAVATFADPTYVDSAPGASGLLFVAEQGGTIRVVKNGTKLAQPFLDIQSLVASGGERGLLSFAFDPGYKDNRRFYVFYTNKDCAAGGSACNLEVDGFRRSATSPTKAVLSTKVKIIEITHHDAGNHNGGQLQFGHDGFLYVSTGDGGIQQDPENDAQSTGSLLGKILRIDPLAAGGYNVPATNPFAGATPGADEIYSYGLRNPFRFSFDAKTGDIWIGDVGYATWEEIDHATQAGANGANFGWNVYEGPDLTTFGGGGPVSNYQPPVHYYSHPGGSGTEHGSVIIGGYVIRDQNLAAALRGDYLYTDNQAGDLRAWDPVSNAVAKLGPTIPSPTSFGEGNRKRLYVASGNYGGNGKVYKLIPG